MLNFRENSCGLTSFSRHEILAHPPTSTAKKVATRIRPHTPKSSPEKIAEMGTGKKEAARRERQGKERDGMSNVKVKVREKQDLQSAILTTTQGENFYRDAKKVKVLNRLKDGKPQRNAEGKITKAASYQSRDIPVARIEPNRKW
jgi:hypothetical protein